MKVKKLITSALPYVNNSPHLGNIIGCVLSADVYARFCRQRGYETLYVCGTDEYGTATETAALKAGVSPKELCDKFFVIHEAVYKFFNISTDAFGRTSDSVHSEVVQDMFLHASKNDFFTSLASEQVYCSSCARFLADRFVEGECPHCSYQDARGDQCDSCAKLLSPTELKKPRCSLCHQTPTTKTTTHLYLDLEKLSPQLSALHQDVIKNWTTNAATTTMSWMDAGLKSRPITRDLKWGVKVPHPDFTDKVFYVWFDAPIGYVSITKKAFPKTWQDWWMNPENVQLYQFMAKDNIPFHSIIFPAVQLATGQNWTKIHHLNATEYLNYENSKFSKSKNHGVFGSDVLELGIPADLWRYYLLATRPEKQDGSFLWDEFFDKINKEFIDIIANFMNRHLVFLHKKFNGLITGPQTDSARYEGLVAELKVLYARVTECLEQVEIKEALKAIVHIGKLANKAFQDFAPWANKDPETCHEDVSFLAHVAKDLGIMLHPFMPEASQKIARTLNMKDAMTWSQIGDFTLLNGITIEAPELLFKKLDPDLLPQYKERFSNEASVV